MSLNEKWEFIVGNKSEMIQTILDTFHSFAYHCNLFANTYIRVRGNVSIMETEFNCFTESRKRRKEIVEENENKNRFFPHNKIKLWKD